MDVFIKEELLHLKMIDNVYSVLQLTGTNCRRTVRIDVSWQNARGAHIMAH